MTAFISPFRSERKRVRDLFKPGEFIEVYCDCSLDTCEQRDVKGLYAKARAGLIPNYTGISSPYEKPESPEVTVNTDKETLDESVAKVIDYLRQQQFIG